MEKNKRTVVLQYGDVIIVMRIRGGETHVHQRYLSWCNQYCLTCQYYRHHWNCRASRCSLLACTQSPRNHTFLPLPYCKNLVQYRAQTTKPLSYLVHSCHDAAYLLQYEAFRYALSRYVCVEGRVQLWCSSATPSAVAFSSSRTKNNATAHRESGAGASWAEVRNFRIARTARYWSYDGTFASAPSAESMIQSREHVIIWNRL